MSRQPIRQLLLTAFEDVVILAFPEFKFDKILSVATSREGVGISLAPGSFVEVVNGMVFNVADTSRA